MDPGLTVYSSGYSCTNVEASVHASILHVAELYLSLLSIESDTMLDLYKEA